MSKVYVYRAAAKDTYVVSRATVATGWAPGQVFCLNTTGEFAQLASGNNGYMVGADDDTLASGVADVFVPPTGSVVSVVYGEGTRFVIDHTLEAAAGSAVRAYSTDASLTASIYGLTGSTLPTLHRTPESGSVNQNLYCNGLGQFSLLPAQIFSASIGGWQLPSASMTTYQPVLGKILQVPNADNGYSLGVILRT